MSTFATRLKELRGTESQASFSATIGINRVQYAKYESGQNSPSVDTLERICRAHACSADWLLGLREPGAPVPAPAPQTAAQQCAKCPYKIKLAKFEKLLKA
jgi:transcriptional regulator with XRE-family HTH domain